MQLTRFRSAGPPRRARSIRAYLPGARVLDESLDAGLWSAALLIVAVTTLVRLAVAAAVPLVPDEAYYWEWSRRLALGYFDHPPVLAWMIRPGTMLVGESALGVRLPSVLAGGTAMWLVADLARRHGGNRAALRAALVGALLPLSAVGLVLATPDAPLLLAYAAGIAAVDRALAVPPGTRASYLWWAAAGSAAGLGMAAKYTAVLFPAGVAVAFLLRGSLRARLRAPEPYLAAVLALAVFTPVVAWNAANGWVSFAFQLGHGLGAPSGSALPRVLEMVGGQVGLVTPIVFTLMAAAAVAPLVRRGSDRRFVLALVALVTFGFFLLSATRQRVEPNWPAAAYVAGIVLLSTAWFRARGRRLFAAGVILAGVLTGLTYLHAVRPILPVRPSADPIARAYGWADLALAAASVRDGVRPPPGATVAVAANRYQDAAQLAFHLPGRPRVHSLNVAGRPNQYDLWPGYPSTARAGDILVLVLDGRGERDAIPELRAHFETTTFTERAELRRNGAVIDVRSIWVLAGWRGSWPATDR
jgi:4-amino-4-deoxy-L-arabinose transferase-like glycosyltransferase